MTSEGQHAGQQAEATSGGGETEPAAGSAYGAPRAPGGYPPDGDEQPNDSAAAPQAGWEQDAYPDSYGPPPYLSSGTGSPFVVPAVGALSTPNGAAQAFGAAGSSAGTPGFRSSAQVPAADGTGGPASVWGPPPTAEPDRRDDASSAPRPTEPHPYRATAGTDGLDPGSFGAPVQDHPFRDDADGHPYRSAGSTPLPLATSPSRPGASHPDAGGPHPDAGGPFPDAGTSRADAGDGIGRDSGPAPASTADSRLMPGGPLPSRADRAPFGGPDGPGSPDAMSGFNGFVSSSPARGSHGPGPTASGPSASRPGTDPAGDGRAPGISAFGGQRVRVPGAALSGLPDTPPAVDAGRPADSSGFHLRGRADAAANGDDGFGALPQPRTPTDPSPTQPGPGATGTARPVTASASVPVASRVTPPIDGGDPPMSGSASPLPRVYGRPAPGDQQDPPAAPDSPAPVSPFPSDEGDHPYRSAAAVADNGHHPNGRTRPGYGFHDADPHSPAGSPTGRAAVSARVTPPSGAAGPFTPDAPPPFPPPDSPASFGPASFSSGPATAAAPHAGQPYSEHTTDVSGRGRARTAPVDRAGGFAPAAFPVAGGYPGAQFSEHTTDVAGRGGRAEHPYGAAPTLHAAPPLRADPPGADGFPAGAGGFSPGGVFPGPTSRPTVTPPEQAATPTWPAVNGGRGRDALKPDSAAAVQMVAPTVEKTETPTVRMLPVLLGVILAAALLVGMAIGVVWLIARPGDAGFDVNAGDCVKRDGDKAVTATCGDPGSFEVVSKVDKKEQCADSGQPYVVNPAGDGRSQVLCLKPTD